MRVVRAESAGFCMGVDLALKKLEEALGEMPPKGVAVGLRICTLGPIIHNPQVLADFAAKGVECLEDFNSAQSGDYVLIRAHGVPRQVEAALQMRCAFVRDATCPKVKKAQLAIDKATANGAFLLLFGEPDHPEVAGLVSYANNGAQVFSSPAELEAMEIDLGAKYVLAAQTTQDRAIFNGICEDLRSRLPDLVILSTICDATRQRQDEALRIAAQVDKMVVVGGQSSGNTRRLAAIAANAGIDTFHIEDVSELDAADFRNARAVGLTAGASTPGALIDEVEEWLGKVVQN